MTRAANLHSGTSWLTCWQDILVAQVVLLCVPLVPVTQTGRRPEMIDHGGLCIATGTL